ncbi:hypothetical protein GCM10007362_08230 [Saccharibacillus endophyticus]|uniref:Uncharacterized protein n=1 Tax=Saccharibacillus endophyticus TaxID=2060666 RepID=A0ABQ1ZQN1_9BACL|nr:hypothetical protein GCM10007362_08230 [Saccharibacillus endophyticus]
MKKRTLITIACMLLLMLLVSLPAPSQSSAFEIDAATKQRLAEQYGLDEPSEAEPPFYADFGSTIPYASGYIDDSGIYFDDLRGVAHMLGVFSIIGHAPLPTCTRNFIWFLSNVSES